MTLALKDIPAHELVAAPREWRLNGSGMGVKVISAEWLGKRLALMEEERLRAKMDLHAALAIEWFSAAHLEIDSAPPVLGVYVPPPHVQVIRDVLRHHGGITLKDLKGHSRALKIAAARQHAMYEIRRQLGMSLPEIGRRFGGRDHTTALHAVQSWPEKAARLGIPCEPLPRDRDRIIQPERTVRGF